MNIEWNKNIQTLFEMQTSFAYTSKFLNSKEEWKRLFISCENVAYAKKISEILPFAQRFVFMIYWVNRKQIEAYGKHSNEMCLCENFSMHKLVDRPLFSEIQFLFLVVYISFREYKRKPPLFFLSVISVKLATLMHTYNEVSINT